MNRDLLIIMSIPFGVAFVYFMFFENPNLSFFNVVPKDFITEAQDFFTPDPPTQPAEIDEFFGVLTNTNETESNKIEQLVEETKELRAEYTVTFKVLWSSETHPTSYPDNAHFSPPVVWAHNEKFEAFEVGSLASPGIEGMAELGGTITLEKELESSKQNGVFSYAVGKRVDAPGETKAVIKVRDGFGYISVVSMIAPSPDWFVAAEDINLYENGVWLDTVTVPVFGFDAGTEDGNELSVTNPATIPSQPISVLAPELYSDLAPFAEVTITKNN